VDILRQNRLVRIFFIFGFCFIGLLYRFWEIQIKEGELYSYLALEQGSRGVSLEDVSRGKILDRNMVSLTGTGMEDRIVVFPGALVNQAEVIRGLAGILGVDISKVAGYLKGGPGYLPYEVTSAQSAAVKKRGWSGVMVLPVRFRYGERPLAAHITGHLGKITSREEFLDLSDKSKKMYRYNDLVGKTGLEKFYESCLKGTRPQRAVRVFTDAGGRLLGGPEFNIEEQLEDQERCDLVLTLDARIQQVVEEIMDRRLVRGAVVVMEAGTGDILAMASRPGFNPAYPEQYLESGVKGRFLDHCTALYQPGSIFKIVVAAAALEESVAGPETTFTCRGDRDNLIHCWLEEGHGNIDFPRAFAQSCNPAFARLGLALGAPGVIQYAERLGLANQSVAGYPVPFNPRQDLDLIGEPFNLVNSSVGQGPVLVTPLQVTSMMNVIVSGGIYRQPRLVKEIRKSGGEVVRKYTSDQGRRAISPGTARKLCSLLELVVDEGVGKKANVPVFGSAGKTGSAQTGNGLINAWFTGYAPRVNPRLVVTVLLEQGTSGGESAAPVFSEIMERILSLDRFD